MIEKKLVFFGACVKVVISKADFVDVVSEGQHLRKLLSEAGFDILSVSVYSNLKQFEIYLKGHVADLDLDKLRELVEEANDDDTNGTEGGGVMIEGYSHQFNGPFVITLRGSSPESVRANARMLTAALEAVGLDANFTGMSGEARCDVVIL